MALTDENMVMPVQPMNNYGGGGFGFGGDWAWILLLLVLFGNNGWGNGNNGMNGLYPWMNNANQINDGFRDQMIGTQISAIPAGFASVNAGIAAAQNAMQLTFLQQANALQAQLAQCCCDNRAATNDLKYTIATEACANRTAAAANTQRILDQMCSDKLDEKNDEIAQLRAQINALNLAASQGAQTAAIIANNEAQTTALERYLAPTPVPAYVVQNPNCCAQNYGCGCGMAA